MELHHKAFGQGPPLVILHGLFGMLDNWQTLGKRFAEHFSVFLLDQRNHGRSPHAEEFNYPILAQDLLEFLEGQWIFKTHLLGHSLGGKTAMQFALDHPDRVERLVVVDIAPKRYPSGHEAIFQALEAVPLHEVRSRKEAEAFLAERIPEAGVRLFLLKNLRRQKDGSFAWKMNLPVLHRHYEEVLAPVESDGPFQGPTLFVRGGRSQYLEPEDFDDIRRLFPAARFATIERAGHWVHADAPEDFYRIVLDFLLED